MGPARWSCIYFVAVVTPFPVLTQLLFTHYPNGVISKISFYSPRSIGDFKGLVCMPVGGRLQILEGSVRICRHKRWVSDSDTVRWVRHTVWWVSGTNDEKGGVGQVKDGWVGGGCLYSQQTGLEQKMEGTHKSDEPVSNTTRNCWGGDPMVMLPTYMSYRDQEGWVSVDLAPLDFHTASSLWVSHVSWDHFLTTMLLTMFLTEVPAFDIFSRTTQHEGY